MTPMWPVSADPTPKSPARRALVGAAVLAVAILGMGMTSSSWAQTPAAGLAAASRPDWSELSPAQRVALRPLAASWAGISEPQKRKWLALSQNYPNLPAAEQATLHSRMHEWALLSPSQRNQARLNFAETKKLSPDEKKNRWEAYQALSPAEKKQLAAGAPTKPVGAAPALIPPAPGQKLADVPPSRPDKKNSPRLAKLPQNGGNANALTSQN